MKSLRLVVLVLALSGCFHGVREPAPPETLHSSGTFAHPLPGPKLLSPCGKRELRFHTGVDLQKSRAGGEPVLASRAGVVVRAQTMSGYGRMVEIRHEDGFSTRYAHLKKIDVRLK